MRPKRTSLRVEGLETRENLSAAVVAGDLFVTGDAASDQVQRKGPDEKALPMIERVSPRRRGSYGIDAPYAPAFLTGLAALYLVLAVTSGRLTYVPALPF